MENKETEKWGEKEEKEKWEKKEMENRDEKEKKENIENVLCIINYWSRLLLKNTPKSMGFKNIKYVINVLNGTGNLGNAQNKSFFLKDVFPNVFTIYIFFNFHIKMGFIRCGVYWAYI